jgi:hypothetical protein
MATESKYRDSEPDLQTRAKARMLRSMHRREARCDSHTDLAGYLHGR